MGREYQIQESIPNELAPDRFRETIQRFPNVKYIWGLYTDDCDADIYRVDNFIVVYHRDHRYNDLRIIIDGPDEEPSSGSVRNLEIFIDSHVESLGKETLR